ncbi:hypothetical protein GP486_004494 [Trichoglossum hirsutum]|uniref:AAA+ ATPase domain-containing protein n=1 Tax=Trichoglossum hirsutum TaxID=265104 RepID=A0A9P8LB26_9PEZI|nr:hypothetical protein GP486_004494 [Trichoglossum hirsutum]
MPPEILTPDSSQSATDCLDATATTDSVHFPDGGTTPPARVPIRKTGNGLPEQQDPAVQPVDGLLGDGIPVGDEYQQGQGQSSSGSNDIQPKEYIKRIEDRLLFLEEKFRDLERDVASTPVRSPTPVVKESTFPSSNSESHEPLTSPPPRPLPFLSPWLPEESIEPKINRLSLPMGVTLRQLDLKNKPSSPKAIAAIEAYWQDVGHSHVARPDSSEQEASRLPSYSSETETKSPVQVRIRSSIIARLLSNVLGEEILKGAIFIYPFKAFISHEEAIRKEVGKVEKDTELNLELLQSVTKLDEQKRDVADENLTNGVGTGTGEPTVERDKLAYLQCLIEFMDEDMKYIWELREKIRLGTSLKSIAYTDLWHLFTPGEVIIPANGGKRHLFRVTHAVGARRYLSDRFEYIPALGEDHTAEGEVSASTQPPYLVTRDRLSPFYIDCFYLDFDGKVVGAVQARYMIQSYEGMRPITSLSVYPVKYAEGGTDKFRERGDKFVSMTRVGHKHYTGLSLDEPKEEIDSQVIVDPALAFLSRPEWTVKLGLPFVHCAGDARETLDIICGVKDCANHRDISIFDDNKFEKRLCEESLSVFTRPKPVEKLTDEELSLLCNRTYGFVLRSRKWSTLDLGLLQNVVTRDDGFNSLVLPEGHKELVRALVVAHAKGAMAVPEDAKEHQVDLVRGKGKGLIILLHGVPGVGKTSTAGDIGETASEVEENLEKNFQLAHKWGCVLLLDEADVFLQKRDKADMKRNSLVSVFLRVLEYYSGILFLTTNRVGTFDEAFKSRIHISLYYPALNKRSTLKVWKMNLERTKRGKEDFEIKESEIIAFAKHHYITSSKSGRWNGRQIRNAFQTAIALAEHEAKSPGSKGNASERCTPILRKGHFEKVAEASAEFNRYLVQVFSGDDDSRRAELDQVRLDDYKSHKSQPRIKVTGSNKQPSRHRYHETVEEEEPSSFSDSSDDNNDDGNSDSDISDSTSKNGNRKQRMDDEKKEKGSARKSATGKSAKRSKKTRWEVDSEEEESGPTSEEKQKPKKGRK